MLIDFKMYDNNGIGSPQRAVRPDFNLGEAERIMDEYTGGHQNLPVAHDVVRDFVKEKQGESSEVFYDDRKKYSERVTDEDTLDFLNNQETVTTYKTMQLVDGKLYPPMAAVVAGKYEDSSELGTWEATVEHPELIKWGDDGKAYFKLDKGQKRGSLDARYNPYMHSSNLVLNDQFTGAYTRDNLVTVQCEVPVSELTSGYHAEHAKDPVGWHAWHAGPVAGTLRNVTGTERQVLLSRWNKPVRIVPDSEVAAMYKELLDGTGITVPENVVPPGLKAELEKAGVPIASKDEAKKLNDALKKGKKSNIKYSPRNYDVEVSDLEIADNIDSVAAMDSVVSLNGDEVVFGDGKLKATIVNYFNSIGGKAYNDVLGDVELTNRSYKDDLGHGMYPLKALTFYAVPSVIEKGKIIDYQPNWQGKGIRTYIIAAPITINSGENKGEYWLGVIAQADRNSQRLYAHDVVAIKKESLDALQTGTTFENSRFPGGTKLSIESILQQLNAVKYADAAKRNQLRDFSNLSDRELLVQALETDLTPEERSHLERYKAKVEDIGKDQHRLDEFNSKIVELRKAGYTAKTSEELRVAETNAKTMRNRIDRKDADLKKIESAAMIQEVVKRNRAEARKSAYSLARQRADERQARAVERAREVGQKKLDKLRERSEKALEKSRESGQKKLDRLKESQAKEKYKKRIIDDANTLMKWITSPVAGSSVPKFLAVPISDFIDAIDFSGRKALKARDILESGDDTKIAEWLGEAIKRRDKAKQTYELAKAQYEAIKEAYSEEEIGGDKKSRSIAEEEIKEAEKRMNIAKGRYEMEARAVENGIESSASAYTNRDMTITKALENMRKAISNYSKEYQNLNEGKEAEYKFLDLPEAFTETIDELVTNIEDSFAKYAERDLYTDALADTPLNRMNADQLKRLSEIITTIRTSVRQINTNLANARYESSKDMSNHTIDDMNELTERKKVNKAVEAVNSIFNWKNSTPIMAFQKLGRGGKAVFEAMQNGWDKMARNSAEVIKYAEDTFNAKESNAWSKEVSEIELDSGKTVQMTVAQKMSLYCLSKREQAKGHLLGGGIRISDIDGKRGTKITQTGNYVLTQADIDNIIDSLTDRQIEVADKLQAFMNTVCAEWGNEISMKRFGYEQMTEDNYFPIESDKNNLKKIDETQDGRTSMFRLLNMSSLKPLTPNANNAIVIHDIFDVFADHASNMAKYNAMALPILDFIKWYNYSEKIPVVDASGKPTGQHETKSVRRALERAYGKDADSYLLNFIKDINAEHDGGRNDGIINKFMNLAKAASVGANLRVYALQITSLPRAAYVINSKYLAKGVAAHKKKGAAQENVGILQWKALGFFSTDIARNTRTMIKQDENWLAKARGWQMKPAELMDKVTANILYEAVKAEMADLHKNVKPGSDQYKRMVNDRVREIIYKTQVADSTMTRSELMRSKGAWPMFTAFMSESTITVNMLNEGIQEAIYKKRGGTLDENDIKPGTKIYKATMCFIASGMFSAMVAAAFGAFRDDDEYETFKEKYLDALKNSAMDNLNVLSMLPLINEASDAIGAALKGEEYSFDTLAAQSLTSLVGTIKAVSEYAKGNRTFTNMFYNVLKTLSYSSGVGVYNAVRDVFSIYNTFFAPAFNAPKLQNYKTSEKKTATALYKAAQDGNTALFDEYVSRAEMYGIVPEDLEGEYNKLISDDYLAGDIGEDEARSMLKMYGGKTTYQAQTVLDKLDYQKESGEKFSDVEKNYVSGKISKADAKAALTKYGDTTASDADDKILTWDYEKTTGRKYSSLDNAYIRGEVTRAEIKSAKIKYGGKDSSSAESTILHLDYQKKTGRPWSKLMDDYHAGRFNSTQLKKYFMDYDGKSENEALDLVDKYDWAKTHGGSTDGYSKYVTIHEAIDSGRGFDEAVQKIVDKYTARGKKEKDILSDIRSSITSKYKPIYLASSASVQAEMREYLLDAYVALGGKYSTYYKNMTDTWFDN